MAAAIVILGPGLPSRGDFRFRSGVYNWLMHIRSLSQSFRLLAKCILSAALLPAAYSQTIESHTAEIDGVKLHYLTAGHGAPLVLLHGYAETSLMWRPIMPLLAERFTVIAPDLPGIGDSAIPANGLDMRNAAIPMNGLAQLLGVQKSSVVGHDIGL